MAFSDWRVDVLDVVAQKNVQKNQLGQLIDPGGLTVSLVTMTLRHLPTDKVLNRADQFSSPSKDAFLAYARGIVAVADQNMAVQSQPGSLSPLAGVLDLVPVVVEPTPDQQAQQAFQSAFSVLGQLQALVSAGDLHADDPAIAQATAIVEKTRTQAKAAELAALKASLDALPVAAVDAQPSLIARARGMVSRMFS